MYEQAKTMPGFQDARPMGLAMLGACLHHATLCLPWDYKSGPHLQTPPLLFETSIEHVVTEIAICLHIIAA